MKKRTVAVVMAAAMTIGMMVTGVSVQAGVEDKTLIVGFDAEYPPYGYMDDDGEYTGFDLELAQAVCDLEGWELEKKPINWDSKDMELNSGTIDCIWNGFTMNGREDDYTFSDPYVDNSQVIVIPEDSDIADLAGLAGTQEGPGGFVTACTRFPRRFAQRDGGIPRFIDLPPSPFRGNDSTFLYAAFSFTYCLFSIIIQYFYS